MKIKALRFAYQQRYLIWGAVVVCVVTALTGLATTAIVGYTSGIACLKLLERFT